MPKKLLATQEDGNTIGVHEVNAEEVAESIEAPSDSVAAQDEELKQNLDP